MLKFKEDDKDFIHLKIKNADFLKFSALYFSIKKDVGNKKKVNSKQFNDLFEIIIPRDDSKNEHYKALSKSLYEEVLEYFTLPKMNYGFTFSEKGMMEDIPTAKGKSSRTKTKVDYTLAKMLNEVVVESVRLFESETIKRKFLTATYKNISSYMSQLPQMKKHYSHYKISTIVAYIAYRLDYNLSKVLAEHKAESSRPTTNELYNAVKHTLKSSNILTKKKKPRV